VIRMRCLDVVAGIMVMADLRRRQRMG